MDNMTATDRYLNSLLENYQVTSYVFTPTGANRLVKIAPYNPNRVSFYCQFPGNTQPVGTLSSDGALLQFPSSGSLIPHIFVTTTHHQILPMQEIWYFDNIFLGTPVSCWGIVKKG